MGPPGFRARLLAEYRGKRNRKALPRLACRQIVQWADAYDQRTGRWPKLHSDPIPEAPEEAWAIVQAALTQGLRGLRGGSSLALAGRMAGGAQSAGPAAVDG
jgi:hypothetical protein